MKRQILVAVATLVAALAAVGTAAAWDKPTTPPSPPTQSIEQGQGNQSSQSQVQVVPIAPQVNVQNVNVLTGGDVQQGDANNANTGQANQQQNTQVAIQKAGRGPTKSDGCAQPSGAIQRAGKAGERAWSPACCTSGPPSSGSQSVSQHQGNWSWQKQIQFIPIAPQLNAQNVNFLTWGSSSQGDANNANTGQANQQENRQFAFQHGGWSIT